MAADGAFKDRAAPAGRWETLRVIYSVGWEEMELWIVRKRL